MSAKKFPGLTGNQLKILAMIAMTADHVGLELLPQFPILRIIGRLAMPVFAYMIAEGCRHTHDRKGYLLRLAGLAAVCQLAAFLAIGSLYQCILVTFSLSVCLIYALDRSPAAGLCAIAVIGFLSIGLPRLVPGFSIDYGFFGILLPAAVYFGKTKEKSLTFFSLVLLLLANELGGIQWFSLAAVPILALYNGQRGKYRIGTFFYLYYPLHLAVIRAVSLLIK